MLYRCLFILISLVILSGCGRPSYETVIISGQTSSGITTIRGQGVRLLPDIILTSAHVTPEDTLIYRVGTGVYRVSERDSTSDRSIIVRSGSTVSPSCLSAPVDKRPSWCPDMGSARKKLEFGSSIYTTLYRSGSLVTLTGQVLNRDANMIGYDHLGRTQMLSGVVLTDLVLQAGESGAPLYDSHGDLIDVIHVR